MSEQPIEFEAGGLTLRGRLFVADTPKKQAFLFLSGWTGRQNFKAAALLAKHGYTSMTFDSAGHGNSDSDLADYKISEFLDFAIAAYDFFKSKLDPGQNIGL